MRTAGAMNQYCVKQSRPITRRCFLLMSEDSTATGNEFLSDHSDMRVPDWLSRHGAQQTSEALRALRQECSNYSIVLELRISLLLLVQSDLFGDFVGFGARLIERFLRIGTAHRRLNRVVDQVVIALRLQKCEILEPMLAAKL